MVQYSLSEKRKPTYDLDAFKDACSTPEKMNITGTALDTAADIGFTRQNIVEVIQTMIRVHFYKSMTSHADHRAWQDVYHVPSEAGVLYVKFTADAVTDFRVLSFKEKDNG